MSIFPTPTVSPSVRGVRKVTRSEKKGTGSFGAGDGVNRTGHDSSGLT